MSELLALMILVAVLTTISIIWTYKTTPKGE